MAFFYPEPHIATNNNRQPKTAVLLVNLGTPASASVKDVKTYLAEFLSDSRVIEAPKWLWNVILYGVILPFRPKKSAKNYAKIWSKEGSPLMVFTQQQTQLLKERFQAAHSQVIVDFAMTYGKPSVKDQLAQLKAQGVEQILVLPLYPQYAASSTGAALDKVYLEVLKQRNMMSVRTIKHYYDDADYIRALAATIERHWKNKGRAQKLLLSFHGIPKISVKKGDPYYNQCQKTSELLARELSLSEDDYVMCFQSRFGPAKWIGPSTQDLFEELPKQGITSIDIICPGFSSDCLETMEEICLQGKEDFHAAGGVQFQYIPCLNTEPEWIDAMFQLVKRNLQGWE